MENKIMSEETSSIKELIKSQQYYKLFFDQSKDAIYITAKDGALIDVNNSFLLLFGYNRQEVISLNAKDFYVNPDDREIFTKELVLKKQLDEYELRLKKKNGEEMDCMLTASIHLTQAGLHIGFQGTIRDITKEKESREQLRKLSSAVESSANIVIIIDKYANIEYVNQKFCSITGYDKNDVLGQNPRILESGESTLEGFKEIWKKLKNGDSWSGYLHNKKKNGDFFWVYSSISPMKNEGGEITHYIGILEDVTKRLESEKALKLSEERFRAVFENASIGIVLVDINGIILRTNKAFRTYLEYTEEEILTKNYLELLKIDDNITLENIFKDKIKDSKEYRFITKNKKIIWTKSSISRLNDAENKIDYYLILVEDITEKKRIEADKERLLQQLHHSQKMDAIGQLAGGIAHDFNNLLAGIIGNADLLAIGIKDKEKIELVNQILIASERAVDLNQKLLTFARKSTHDLKPININIVISEVIDILKRTIDKRITIHKHYKSRKLIVMGDVSQLHNIILNIALNARDAMVGGGELIFSTLRVKLDKEFCQLQVPQIKSGKYVEIKIIDNGIGMNEVTKSKIFEPFFTTKLGKGVGLGLASVYGSIVSHKGTVKVESQIHQGTTFFIYLPLSDKKIKIDRPKKLTEEKSIKKHIMLVDDEEILLKVVSKTLEKAGHKVICFRDSLEAIEEYQSIAQIIDIALLDINMPVMDGWGLYEELKKINPNVKVIFYSGYLSIDENRYKHDKNILGYLKKPFRRDELLNFINK